MHCSRSPTCPPATAGRGPREGQRSSRRRSCRATSTSSRSRSPRRAGRPCAASTASRSGLDQERPERRDDLGGLPRDPLPREADDRVAHDREVGGLDRVLLIRVAGAVVLRPVGLDDELVARPEEVDLVAADVDIDFRRRDAGGLAQREEPVLEDTAGRRRGSVEEGLEASPDLVALSLGRRP